MLDLAVNKAKSFPFTASPPCCRGCSFTAGEVQVYHWPTTSPLFSILSNTDGLKLYASVNII